LATLHLRLNVVEPVVAPVLATVDSVVQPIVTPVLATVDSVVQPIVAPALTTVDSAVAVLLSGTSQLPVVASVDPSTPPADGSTPPTPTLAVSIATTPVAADVQASNVGVVQQVASQTVAVNPVTIAVESPTAAASSGAVAPTRTPTSGQAATLTAPSAPTPTVAATLPTAEAAPSHLDSLASMASVLPAAATAPAANGALTSLAALTSSSDGAERVVADSGGGGEGTTLRTDGAADEAAPSAPTAATANGGADAPVDPPEVPNGDREVMLGDDDAPPADPTPAESAPGLVPLQDGSPAVVGAFLAARRLDPEAAPADGKATERFVPGLDQAPATARTAEVKAAVEARPAAEAVWTEVGRASRGGGELRLACLFGGVVLAGGLWQAAAKRRTRPARA
jgi:hypothetical protein